ncbi:UNVERIFIED_CONTAM: hypothetical protein K2H54_072214 [Gekko kuhli]
MSASSLSSEMRLPFSLFLLLLQILGARSQELEVLQTRGPLKLAAGETLHLNCTLMGFGPPGGVKWYKGSDRGQPPVYNDKATAPSPRVARVIPGSAADHSILISSIQPEDAGTYYCVKYKAGIQEMEYKSGKGTEVSVIATPSQPSITGPPSRVDSGASVTFTCISDGFFPRDITVTWFKDGRTIPRLPDLDCAPEREHLLPRGEHRGGVPHREGREIGARLPDPAQHLGRPPCGRASDLATPFESPPKMSTEPGHPVDAILNQLVTITCTARGFYPNDTSLVWRENGIEADLGAPEPVTQEADGTFSVKSSLEVNATEQRNHSVITCHALRNSQTSALATVTLKIHRGKGDGYLANTGQWLSSIPGLCVALVLNKIFAAVLSFLFLRKMLSKMNAQ